MQNQTISIENNQPNNIEKIIQDLENLENATSIKINPDELKNNNLAMFKLGYAFALGKRFETQIPILTILCH